jgi:hypothetical protein
LDKTNFADADNDALVYDLVVTYENPANDPIIETLSVTPDLNDPNLIKFSIDTTNSG